jgi:hypothetical protein
VLVLLDPTDPVTPRHRAEARQAAGLLQLIVVEREASEQADIERVFRALTPGEVEGCSPGECSPLD